RSTGPMVSAQSPADRGPPLRCDLWKQQFCSGRAWWRGCRIRGWDKLGESEFGNFGKPPRCRLRKGLVRRCRRSWRDRFFRWIKLEHLELELGRVVKRHHLWRRDLRGGRQQRPPWERDHSDFEGRRYLESRTIGDAGVTHGCRV